MIRLFHMFLSLSMIVKGSVVYNSTATPAQFRRRLYGANQVFNFAASGQPSTFVVPTGVTSIYVEAVGAASGTGAGGTQGLGAKVTSILSVTPGFPLYIYIGGKGTNNGGAGGFNGGGTTTGGASGGGATDIRDGPGTINNRILVAAGGGGPYTSGCNPSNGGNGGSPNGVAGDDGTCNQGKGGGGASLFSAGTNGNSNCAGCAGSFAEGGLGSTVGGGGGGGGYYGGAGGYAGGAGGGGSSYSIGSGTTYPTPLTNTGHGSLTIFYDPPPTISPTIMPFAPTSQPTGQPSTQPSRKPTAQPSCQPTRQPSQRPVMQPTGWPSGQPSVQPSQQPTAPSCQPTSLPSGQPSVWPSQQPTALPSCQPTRQPSQRPSMQPYSHPSYSPSGQPSCRPTMQPSISPSSQPSCPPSTTPSTQPFCIPSCQPTVTPSVLPSIGPSGQPSNWPSLQPSSVPSRLPSVQPSILPTNQPTLVPFVQPSSIPTCKPSSCPSTRPSVVPSTQPFPQPSGQPIVQPSGKPTIQPTNKPSLSPSSTPSLQPTTHPSAQPSTQPSDAPSIQPLTRPTSQPTTVPSWQPRSAPSCQPSSQPNNHPTGFPSVQPSGAPTGQPGNNPSGIPSDQPSSLPSSLPTSIPIAQPSMFPSSQPTLRPSCQTSVNPSSRPTCQPTNAINFGTLPSNKSISVYSSHGMHGLKFKIVLPFYFAEVNRGFSFEDIHLNPMPTAGTNVFVFGGAILAMETELVTPSVSYNYGGRAVSVLDDINKDTYPDLIIGVPGISVCYVLMGTTDGLVDMTQGFTVFGAESSDSMGWAVNGAGDVNNDGFNDIIIGAPRVKVGHVSNAGAAYVIFGKKQGFKNIDVKRLQTEDGFVVYCSYSSEYCGLSVSGAGDVNGDGIDDVVIGALRAPDMFSGAVYVVFGNATYTEAFTVKALKPQTGFALRGPVWSWCGYSVSGAGDINNDTYADIIVGCVPRKGLQPLSEVSYILYGNRTVSVAGVERDLASVAGATLNSGGVFVSGVGDINNDGIDDVMIGSDYGFNSGGGYVITYPGRLKAPTVAPSTIIPTVTPSMLPTTSVPTTPTSAPSLTPTEPTFTPSMRPSQPTSQPSGMPTLPTCVPSVTPTISPSTVPTMHPSAAPSFTPSVKPSSLPSLESLVPTETPTTIKTLTPTWLRQNRPSVQPTQQPSIANVTRISVTQSGLYVRNITNSIYLVNATGNVTIAVNIVTTGSALFVVLPNAYSLLTIQFFNATSDAIDLTAFVNIHRVEHLALSFNQDGNLRRRLTAVDQYGSLTIGLGQHQSIVLSNVSVSEVTDVHFIFAPLPPPFENMKRSWGPVIVLCSVFGSTFLFITYHVGSMYLDYRSRNKKYFTNWTDEEKSNPTFVTFDPNCSYKSEESDDTDYSSVDLSTEDDLDSNHSEIQHSYFHPDEYDSRQHSMDNSRANSSVDEKVSVMRHDIDRDADSEGGSEYGSELFAFSIGEDSVDSADK